MLLCLRVGFSPLSRSPSCRRLASLRNSEGCLGVTPTAGDTSPPSSEPEAAADEEDGPEESGSKPADAAGGGLPGMEKRTEGWTAAACAWVIAGSAPEREGESE